MSHIVKMELDVTDLDALAKAAQECGCELVDQKTYNWYGESVGDYPLPDGITVEDLGKCDMAIKIKNKLLAYEVGVVKKKQGPGYHLLWDFWNGGFGLEEKIGTNAGLLKQGYTAHAIRNKLARRGNVARMEEIKCDGKRKLVIHLK